MKKMNMALLKTLHICLFLITFQEIGGVQFKHFPAANGRSESNGPRKFQPREPAPPTGRPASSHDINPFHLSHLQVEEEPRSSRRPIARGQAHRTIDTRGETPSGQVSRTIEPRGQVSRTIEPRGQVSRTIDQRGQVSRTIDQRGQVSRTTDQRPSPFVLGTTDSRPFTRDNRPTTVDTRPTTIEGFDSRGRAIAQGPSDRRPVAIEQVQSRGRSPNQTPNPSRPNAIEGFDNRGRPVTQVGRGRTGLSGRPTIQNNEKPTTKSRITEQRRQTNQQEKLSEVKTVRSRGRLPSKRQRGKENVSPRNNNLAEQRRFKLPQREENTDVVTESNFNRARARPSKENNRKVLRIGQKRRKQIRTKVQIQKENQTPRKLPSFPAVPVARSQQPKQRVSISKQDELNEIQMTEIREKMKKHSNKLMADDERKTQPENVGRFPNFGQSNVKTQQNHNIALKQKIEEKHTANEEKELAFIAKSTKEVKEDFQKNVPETAVSQTKQITLPEQNQLESDNDQVKLVPGVVWLNGKKVWETSFLVRDEEEEPRRVEIELDHSKQSQINNDIAVDHREKVTQNNKPKNAFFQIGNSPVEGKEKENIQKTNPSVINSQGINIAPIQTPIKTQPSKQEPVRNLPSINLAAKTLSPQIEQTNELPQNVKPQAKLPFEKPIIKSTIVRQTPLSSTARRPPANIPQQRNILPTQSSFSNTPPITTPPRILPTQAPFIRNPPTQATFRNPPKQAPFRNPPTQATFQSPPTQTSFRNPPILPQAILRSPTTEPPFRNRLSFQNSPTELTFRSTPTQATLQRRPNQANIQASIAHARSLTSNQANLDLAQLRPTQANLAQAPLRPNQAHIGRAPLRPSPANIAQQEFGRFREPTPETKQADPLAFLPLSFNQDFDDSGAININWGR